MALSIVDQARLDAGAQPMSSAPSIVDMARSDAGAGPIVAVAGPNKEHHSFWKGLGDAVYAGVISAGHRIGGIPAATADSGVLGNLADTAVAFGHNVKMPIEGLLQKAVAGAAYGAHRLAPGSSADRATTGYSEAMNDLLARREAEYQAETPDSAGAVLGATAGQILPWMAAAPGKVLDAAGNIVSKGAAYLPKALAAGTEAVPYVAPVTRNLAKATEALSNAGAKGATIAVTQPAASPGMLPEDVLRSGAGQATVGAVLGSGAKTIGSGASAIGVPALRVISPQRVVGENLPNIAGVSAEDFVNALRGPGAAEWVPGSIPTVAQGGAAGLGTNNVPVIQLERWMRSNVPEFLTRFDQRGVGNNDARLGALSQIAGSAADLDAAKAARQSTVGPLYQRAYATPVPGDAELADIMRTGSFGTAAKRAQTIANDELPPRQVVVQLPSKGGTTQSTILGADGQPITTSVTPPGPGMFSVEGLHDTVGALGELPSDVSLGIVGKQNRNVKDIQAALKDWLVTKSPQFGEAQNAYRQASVPINNMEAGQAIMDGFQGSASGNGNATVRLNQFNNARRAAVDKAEYPPDRPTQEVLDAISKDLQRATVSNAGGTPGSSTAMNLKSDDWVTRLLMSGAKGGSSGAADTAAATIGTILGGPGGGAAAHYGVGKVGSWLNGRLLDAWTEALLNPELAASLVEKYQPSQALGPLSIVAPSGGTNAVINP